MWCLRNEESGEVGGAIMYQNRRVRGGCYQNRAQSAVSDERCEKGLFLGF